jgi:hypothetical protein
VLGWITFESELQKGAVKVESVLDLVCVGVLDQLLNVELEKSVDVVSILDILDVQIVVSQITRQSIHEGNKDGFHVHLLLTLFGACVEELRKSVDVELLGEALNHAIQQVLLRHVVLTLSDQL